MKLRRSTMTSFLILVSLVLIFSSWNIPYAQIKLTDNLSLSGFLDMSAETSIAEDEDTEINTSFDQFDNYEMRGNHFKELVNSLGETHE